MGLLELTIVMIAMVMINNNNFGNNNQQQQKQQRQQLHQSTWLYDNVFHIVSYKPKMKYMAITSLNKIIISEFFGKSSGVHRYRRDNDLPHLFMPPTCLGTKDYYGGRFSPH